MSPTPSIACGPLPEVVDLHVSSKIVAGQEVYSVVQNSPLWPNNSDITVSFLGGTGAQKAIVKSAFAKYVVYANVNFVFVKDNSADANIRIAFASPNAWSSIGMQALKLEGQPTMSLGSISKTNPSDIDSAVALHEVGHALGMVHEWDDTNSQLVDPGNDSALSQHAQLYAGKAVSNFPQMDNKSVMSYFLPQHATAHGQGITANFSLSDADKAWLVINYPGRSAVSNGVKWNLLHALDTLSVPPGVSSRVLASRKVSSQRAHYAGLISSNWGQQIPISAKTQSNISREISTADSRQPDSEPPATTPSPTGSAVEENDAGTNDIPNILAAVILHPNFRDTVTKLAEHDLVNHGVNLDQYPIKNPPSAAVSSGVQVQQNIFDDLGDIVNTVGSAVTGLLQSGIQNGVQSGIQNGVQMTSTAAAYPGQPLPPNIQQGIFDVFTSVLKNPIFTNVVTGIVKNVAAAAAAA